MFIPEIVYADAGRMRHERTMSAIRRVFIPVHAPFTDTSNLSRNVLMAIRY
jgi:hypothetical protein